MCVVSYRSTENVHALSARGLQLLIVLEHQRSKKATVVSLCKQAKRPTPS